jgi:hypothetical protein
MYEDGLVSEFAEVAECEVIGVLGDFSVIGQDPLYCAFGVLVIPGLNGFAGGIG